MAGRPDLVPILTRSVSARLHSPTRDRLFDRSIRQSTYMGPHARSGEAARSDPPAPVQAHQSARLEYAPEETGKRAEATVDLGSVVSTDAAGQSPDLRT